MVGRIKEFDSKNKLTLLIPIDDNRKMKTVPVPGAFRSILKFVNKLDVQQLVSMLVRRIAIASVLATSFSMNSALSGNADNLEDAKKHMNAGLMHRAAGQHQKALADFQRASVLNAGDAKIWLQLANSYNILGQNQQAIESVSKAIAISPADVELFLTRAKMTLYSGDASACMEDLKKVMARNPDSREGLLLTASCYSRLGQTSKASEVYKRIIKQPERDRFYYESAGLYYLSQKEFQKAAKVLQEGQLRFPNDGVLHHFRAQALIALGSLREAIQEESFLLRNDAVFPDASRLRGNAFLMIGKTERAAADAKNVLAALPHDIDALGLLLRCSTRMNDFPTKNDVARRLRIESQSVNDDTVLVNIANSQRECGYGQNALYCLKKALQIRKGKGTLGVDSLPDLAAAAGLCVEANQKDQAIEYYKLAVAFSKNDPTYLLELGKLHYEQKHLKEAEQCLNDALEHVDVMRRPKVLNMLAVVYRAQNKTAQALKVEKEAHKLTKVIFERTP